jgi:acyl carrier protein
MQPEMTALIESREHILAELREMLVDRMRLQCQPDEIDPDAPLFGAGFGLDSLDAVELVVSLDTMFGVVIDDNALMRQQMRSLNTLVDLVLAHKAGHVTR